MFSLVVSLAAGLLHLPASYRVGRCRLLRRLPLPEEPHGQHGGHGQQDVRGQVSRPFVASVGEFFNLILVYCMIFRC